MELPFTKYQGSGNDFILIDNRKGDFSFLNPQQISKLCHRNFGIGSDGILFLDPSFDHHFQMRFYNPDGSEPGVCGNGLCCLLHFLHSSVEKKNQYEITCKEKLYTGYIVNDKVAFTMHHVRTLKEPFQIQIEDRNFQACQVLAGVEHLLILVEDLASIDVEKYGKILRYHSDFLPVGTNVSFLQFQGDILEVRTYERGVEGETLCCGSACVSSGYFAATYLSRKSPIQISPKSREMIAINVKSSDNKVEMIAQAKPVYRGVAWIDFKR